MTTRQLHPAMTNTAATIIVRAAVNAGPIVEVYNVLLGFVQRIDSFSGYQLREHGLTEEFLREHAPVHTSERDLELWLDRREGFGFHYTPAAYGLLESALAQAVFDYGSTARFSPEYLLEAILLSEDPEAMALFKEAKVDTVDLLAAVEQPHRQQSEDEN